VHERQPEKKFKSGAYIVWVSAHRLRSVGSQRSNEIQRSISSGARRPATQAAAA